MDLILKEKGTLMEKLRHQLITSQAGDEMRPMIEKGDIEVVPTQTTSPNYTVLEIQWNGVRGMSSAKTMTCITLLPHCYQGSDLYVDNDASYGLHSIVASMRSGYQVFIRPTFLLKSWYRYRDGSYCEELKWKDVVTEICREGYPLLVGYAKVDDPESLQKSMTDAEVFDVAREVIGLVFTWKNKDEKEIITLKDDNNLRQAFRA